MDPTRNPHGNAPDEALSEDARPYPPGNGFIPREHQTGSRMGTQSLNAFSEPAPPEDRGPALVPQRPEPQTAQAPADLPPRVTLWMHRFSLVISVIFCIELGMLLAILPWTRVWTDNGYLVNYPVLKMFLQNNFIRGMITGLGLVDIWLGIAEAVHYREAPEPRG